MAEILLWLALGAFGAIILGWIVFALIVVSIQRALWR